MKFKHLWISVVMPLILTVAGCSTTNSGMKSNNASPAVNEVRQIMAKRLSTSADQIQVIPLANKGAKARFEVLYKNHRSILSVPLRKVSTMEYIPCWHCVKFCPPDGIGTLVCCDVEPCPN